MMINKAVLFAIVSLVMLVQYVSSQDVADSCSMHLITEEVGKYKEMATTADFNFIYRKINVYCKVDSVQLRTYLIRIINAYLFEHKTDFQKSYNVAWQVMRGSTWGDDYENLIIRILMKCKKEKNFEGFYNQAAALVAHSKNWFQYAMEVYHANDTTSSSERSEVYNKMMERFGKNTSTPDKIKAESYLYAVFMNEVNSNFDVIDSYLSETSPTYKNSKQRHERIRELERYFTRRKKEIDFPFIAAFDYINRVNSYFDSLKVTTGYAPSFIVE